jgi:hypothetical protein
MDKTSFPRLTPDNHRLSSPPTPDYNCIAWSANDTERWWQPGLYWPTTTSTGEFGIAVLFQAFQSLGSEECEDGRLEVGFEKVALYGDSLYYTHAARQLPGGKWASKLGKAEDLEHDSPHDLEDGIYGYVVGFLRRPIGQTVADQAAGVESA